MRALPILGDVYESLLRQIVTGVQDSLSALFELGYGRLVCGEDDSDELAGFVYGGMTECCG